MKRVASVLFWSVIAAAFIGPGTVTACGKAGADHGTALLWALTFSGFACFTLQEGAARVTAVSGTTLATAIRRRSPPGPARWASLGLVAGAVVVGCAAYEAGNLLGAVTGLRLAGVGTDAAWPWWALTVAAAGLLATGTARGIARALGALVAVMAVAFLVAAVRLAPDPGAVLRGALSPDVPAGASLVVLGLVGTTVVPYNLFLGSGLARGQSLGELRFGLAVAVGLGVAVSMTIVVVGTAVDGPFGLDGLAGALGGRLGPWAAVAFAVGLVAAGFSSAVTAPLAAALTADDLFGREDGPRGGARFRAVWVLVLTVGLVFGLAGYRPVELILAVQALNGVLLPFVALFLWFVVNDRALLGDRVNRAASNVAFGITVAVTLVLGSWGVLRAGTAALSAEPPSNRTVFATSAAVAAVLAVPLARGLARARRR